MHSKLFYYKCLLTRVSRILLYKEKIKPFWELQIQGYGVFRALNAVPLARPDLPVLPRITKRKAIFITYVYIIILTGSSYQIRMLRKLYFIFLVYNRVTFRFCFQRFANIWSKHTSSLAFQQKYFQILTKTLVFVHRLQETVQVRWVWQLFSNYSTWHIHSWIKDLKIVTLRSCPKNISMPSSV